MDDMKDKVKGFMKKVNNPFSSSSSSSSSGKFKGQGRVLGSSSSGPSSNPILSRPSQPTPQSKPIPSSNSSSAASLDSKPSSQKAQISDQSGSQLSNNSNADRKPGNGFDPFDSLITTGKRSKNGYSLNVYECPICGKPYGSEEEVSVHVDSCVNNSVENDRVDNGASGLPTNGGESSHSELEICIGTFISGKPPTDSVEVVLKLLSNIVREPENAKFRKIRMSNPKIREAIGEVAGGVELLEIVGFELREEEGDMWAAMEVPSEERIGIIKQAIELLEQPKVQEPQKTKSSSPESVEADEKIEPKKIDRQVRVFFAVSENIAARIVLPESFYNLSADELKREAAARKKKIADSQLLIPKSYKEKQAKASRKRYSKAIIRIQFPDGVVLQGVFLPWEPTSSLYEFVSSALKEQSLEYDLLHPVVVKRRVIPRLAAAAGQKLPTLEEEDLVPSALIKFRPVETDSIAYTGLCNELLEISEPIEADSAVAPL
ncbi:hypothetical protein FNV43_RR26875 [Rhamnella rubrinervis]|uniref:UBX domain-containing protein n=1 Tax=Rhamnella rubrinervis TaxID=2594499 RepID=A0A8K0DNU6_9ROSA|nr:hypothetical protein FNV43_RR26875 [Rhamnella rubrinervis]